MKIFAAATVSESGDHALFVSLSKDSITEQILEMARAEYGDPADDEYYDPDLDGDEETCLLGKYSIYDREFDL